MSETTIEPLTPEQKQVIEEYNKQREKFIDEHLSYLKKQVEYEKALYEIENYNYNREVIKIRLAELKNPEEPKNPEKK